MLNGKKMSKSTGNSLTLREAIEKFGADATRLSLADAGDGLEDANFEEKTANANILRVHTLLGWCEVRIQNPIWFVDSRIDGFCSFCRIWSRIRLISELDLGITMIPSSRTRSTI